MGVSPGSTKAVDNDYRSDIYNNSKKVKKSQSYLPMVPILLPQKHDCSLSVFISRFG